MEWNNAHGLMRDAYMYVRIYAYEICNSAHEKRKKIHLKKKCNNIHVQHVRIHMYRV